MTLTVLNVAYPLAPVGPDAVGGAEQVLTALDAALVRGGHHSIVVACQGSRACGTLRAVPAEPGLLDEPAKARAWARHREAIAEVLRRWPVDVVHLHGIDFWAYLPEDVPTVATLHLPLDWYPAALLLEDRPDLWLLGVSENQCRGAPAGARLLAPIRNGVDCEGLAARHARRNFALVIGRICPEKGVHLAMDAAAAAECPLIVAGQVFRYDAHERYFAEEITPRLGAFCRFIGALGLARKRRFLTAARCLVVPSLVAETSSLAAMEALACGTPVVAMRSGCLPEIVEHGRTGFIVDDVGSMAAAIRAAGDIDPEACRSAARSRFSLDGMTDRYLALYRSLAGQAPAPRRLAAAPA